MKKILLTLSACLIMITVVFVPGAILLKSLPLALVAIVTALLASMCYKVSDKY